jgi:hypothetical protein
MKRSEYYNLEPGDRIKINGKYYEIYGPYIGGYTMWDLETDKLTSFDRQALFEDGCILLI